MNLLDFDICKGVRFNNKKVIGIRLNGIDIYSLIGNYNAYTVEITSRAKKVLFDTSSDYYYSRIDPYFDMGDGTIYYKDVTSYTYNTPGTYLIITSARIDRITKYSTLDGDRPKVLAINGIRRDTVHLDNAFVNCGGSLEFTPIRLNTSRVISAKKTFYNCVGGDDLYLDLSNWDTSSLTDVSDMFRIDADMSKYDSNFHTIDTTGWDTSHITNMSGIFYNNDKLHGVLGIEDWDTGNVTDMSSMFYNCDYLTLPKTISNWDTSKVQNFKNMFYDMRLLGRNDYAGDYTVDFSSWDTSSAKNMNGMFYNCTYLETLSLPWDTSNVIDMSYMFEGCYNLTSIGSLRYWDVSKVESMEGMFAFCSGLSSLDTSKWDTSSAINMSRMFQGLNVSSLYIDTFDTSNVINMSAMFSSCQNLTSLNVNNFNTENVTNMSYMFQSCPLTSLDIRKWNTSKVTDMSYIFNGCKSLTSILGISNLNTRNMTNMTAMFGSCESLTSININNWDINNVNSTYCMFSYCTSLKTLDLSNWKNTSNLHYIGGMFRNCTSLETVDLRNFNIVRSNIEDDIINGYGPFRNCNALREIRLDNCNGETIYCLIKLFRDGLPSDTIENVTRTIFVRQDNLINPYGNEITAPEGWVFSYID